MVRVQSILVMLSVAASCHGQVPTPEVGSQQSPRILTSGPVHEAFLSHGSQQQLQSGRKVNRTPPELIQEPHEQQANQVGDVAGMKWVAGYWAWDAPTDNFVWVPGFYRRVPPERVWHERQWSKTGSTYVRIPGYWGRKDGEPDSVEIAERPLEPVPTQRMIPDGMSFIPGEFQIDGDHRLSWREGFLAKTNDDWVWVPGCTIATSTRNSSRVVSGFWDYPKELRGIPVAAVQIPLDVGEDFTLSPSLRMPIDIGTVQHQRSGDWRYMAIASGQYNATHSNTNEVAFIDVVVPEPPAPVPGTRFVREGEATIIGTVHKGDLQPDGIDLHLQGPTSRLTESEAKGQFRFTNVPYGRYWIIAEGPVQNHTRSGVVLVDVDEPSLRVEIELE